MVRMRTCRALLLALALPMWVGCTTDQTGAKPTWLQQIHSFWTDVGADSMQLEFAYVRRPLGDPYLNDLVWHDIDEQCVPLEKRPALAENGLRVGIINGSIPAKLQHWLCSDGQSDGHRLVMRSGRSSFLPLGSSDYDRTFEVHNGERTRKLDLEKVQCGLAAQIGIAEQGDTLVQLEPRVRHGALPRLPQMARDGQGFEVTGERPEEQFTHLAWEVTITPNDYLIVGGMVDKPKSLGYMCFVQPEGNSQILLVIRAPRASASGTPGNSIAAPLAIQTIRDEPPPAVVKRGQIPD
jgi:hypothetical protein